MRALLCAAYCLMCVLSGRAFADSPSPLFLSASSSSTSSSGAPFTFDLYARGRYELAHWYGASTQDRTYDFYHTKVQLGVGWKDGLYRSYLQGQFFQTYDLPTNATGPGGVYRTVNTNHEYPGAGSVRQGYFEYSNGGDELLLGRSLYQSGSEAAPHNETLATLRSKRIAQRLIGTTDFTGGRSFDGIRGSLANEELGTGSAFFFFPTQGGFETDLSPTIARIRIVGTSWTPPSSLSASANEDAQASAYYYNDERDVVKVDNRPLPIRTADTSGISLVTLGAHYIRVWTFPSGAFDALAWGALQGGRWGEQNDLGGAYVAELGYHATQLAAQPGIRIGNYWGSGDDNPSDGQHHTFFQMIPTGRAYAATPFYNMMNTTDSYLQVSLNPLEHLSARTEFHWLWLSDNNDLFYSGTGANERSHRFGFIGNSTAGAHNIGRLLDFECTWTATKNLAFTGYYGHVFGDSALGAVSGGGRRDINFFFLEAVIKASAPI